MSTTTTKKHKSLKGAAIVFFVLKYIISIGATIAFGYILISRWITIWNAFVNRCPLF